MVDRLGCEEQLLSIALSYCIILYENIILSYHLPLHLVFFTLLICVQSPSVMGLWMTGAGSRLSWRHLVHGDGAMDDGGWFQIGLAASSPR